jgi:hypothetical protein
MFSATIHPEILPEHFQDKNQAISFPEAGYIINQIPRSGLR